MTAIDIQAPPQSPTPARIKLDEPMSIQALLIYLAVIAGALFFMAYSIYSDIEAAGGGPTTITPFLLLGVAMLIALGFEFVNGFHDTANAVATVIYTHALKPQIAVVWSGCFNLLGVLLSSGAVAFGIVSLLPVELILQVGSGAGYAMVFALLIAAIIWNLGTWWLGLPASSSHTMVGSIVGVGIANALMQARSGTSGVDWTQAGNIGTVPTTYALNHAVTASQTQDFIAVSAQTAASLDKYVQASATVGDPREELTEYIRTKEFKPNTMLALREMINGIGTELAIFKELSKVPNDKVRNFRNDMYVVGESIRLMLKSGVPQISTADAAMLKNFKSKHIDRATRFIPLWVKVAVALALGLGTMVGWKRIVVTVGEKIGKNHLTYAQGAAAEITAMATIGAADFYGLPVSTTHVLSSGVAGSMAANHSGIQMSTVRNLALAWVLTLPVAMMLSGFLFWTFTHLFKG